jgi:hypothetical protein
MRTIGRRNLFFQKWVKYTIYIREKIIEKATKFNNIMTHVYNKVDKVYGMKLMLTIWRNNKNRLKKYEKHKRLVNYIARKWLKRVHKDYDLVYYLRIWKRNIVLNRPGIKELFWEPPKEYIQRVKPPYEGKYGQHLWGKISKVPLSKHTFNMMCNGTSVYNVMLRYALDGTKFFKEICG